MIKAIVFDFDGTLVDSSRAMWDAFGKTAREYGMETPSREHILPLLGRPLKTVFEHIWPHLKADTLVASYISHYVQEDVSPITGIRQALTELQQGFAVYLLTGNMRVREQLQYHAIPETLFTEIFTPHNLVHSKPDGRVFAPLLEKYHKDEIIYVGDSPSDAQAAQEAGVCFVGVLSGDATAEELGDGLVINDATALVPLLTEISLPSEFGSFIMQEFPLQGRNHYILRKGTGQENVLVRIHSECFTSEVLGSLRCDCRQQLHASLRMMEKDGGLLIYLRQEGRGIGLSNKLKAYYLQDKGLDTVEANLALNLPADARNYNNAVQILTHLGIRSVRLLTNNPEKVAAVEKGGIAVLERISLNMPVHQHNRKYLETKRQKLGHF